MSDIDLNKAMVSPIVKRVFVAFTICLLLVLFIHQRVEATTLSELSPFPTSEKNILSPNCENAKALLADHSQALSLLHENVVRYLASAADTYNSWYVNLQPYEGHRAKWPAGYFSPLKISAERLNESRDALYLFMDDTGEFLASIVGVLEEPACLADSGEKENLLAQFENYSMIYAEHMGITADFFSGMRSRLEKASQEWAASEKQSPTEVLPNGYFSLLVGDAEIFSNSARVVQNNANYVHRRFEELRALLDPIVLPLAPRP